MNAGGVCSFGVSSNDFERPEWLKTFPTTQWRHAASSRQLSYFFSSTWEPLHTRLSEASSLERMIDLY